MDEKIFIIFCSGILAGFLTQGILLYFLHLRYKKMQKIMEKQNEFLKFFKIKRKKSLTKKM